MRGDLPAAISEPVIQKFDVSALPIISLAARLIPLSEVLTWQVQTTPSQIARQNLTRQVVIGGMLPMALGLGAGAEMRAPMARAVTGGLITSTLLTLLVVPVVYTLFDDFEAWILRLWSGSGRAPS